MNPLLETIAKESAEDFTGLVTENADEIQSAITQAITEATLQEKKASFKLSFTVTINPDKRKFESRLKWQRTTSSSLDHSLSDNRQEQILTEEPESKESS